MVLSSVQLIFIYIASVTIQSRTRLTTKKQRNSLVTSSHNDLVLQGSGEDGGYCILSGIISPIGKLMHVLVRWDDGFDVGQYQFLKNFIVIGVKANGHYYSDTSAM